uniref:trans-1,2-dihydrobenzene-1,2-diol dehydrogenase-like n=1 Tax=Styela clava TaxID=7725 RepID=UPI00193AACD0|nr:trans-1,2-dihydrobenzene-1,2-diol dehydrogenase-like [Styela clava]
MVGGAIRWGICSAGKICQDFAWNLLALPKDEHIIEAVASSSLERSKAFAAERGISKAYGTYQELADDPNIDIVYIGSLNTQHKDQARMMLEGGKAVLCEKPLCMTPKEAKTLFALAKEKNLFLMEAVWSRCSPVYAAIQKTIDDGEIGEVRVVQAMFGDYISDPNHRVMIKELGGGALFDIGIYTLQLAQFVFKECPYEQHAVGFLNDQGVDITSNVALKYTKQRMASLTISTVNVFSNDAHICGTKGYIRIHPPFWTPSAITVNGQVRNFPFPKVDFKMNFRNSEGLTYEAKEVRRCLINKELESPLITHAMSIELAEITEKLRNDLGYKLPHDSDKE